MLDTTNRHKAWQGRNRVPPLRRHMLHGSAPGRKAPETRIAQRPKGIAQRQSGAFPCQARGVALIPQADEAVRLAGDRLKPHHAKRGPISKPCHDDELPRGVTKVRDKLDQIPPATLIATPLRIENLGRGAVIFDQLPQFIECITPVRPARIGQ